MYNITYSTRKNSFCDIIEIFRCGPTFEKNDFIVFVRFYDEF